MRAATRLVTLIAIILLLPGMLTGCAAEEVDLLLVLSSDVSRSIDNLKFKLQRDGYAAAIINPRVVQAIRSGALGKIGVSFVEWSGVGAQKIVIDWTIIHDEASAKDFAAQVIEAPRAFADRTSISGGIDFAVAQLACSPYQAARRTIDISGDGNNNSGRDASVARDEALAKGVTINGLVIRTEQPLSFSAEHTNAPAVSKIITEPMWLAALGPSSWSPRTSIRSGRRSSTSSLQKSRPTHTRSKRSSVDTSVSAKAEPRRARSPVRCVVQTLLRGS